MREIKYGERCEFKDCDKPAVVLVLDRLADYSIKGCCREHGEQILNKDKPEYVEDCPNCGCRMGVN